MDFDSEVQRAVDLYSSRLWSREKAQAMVGLGDPEFIAPRPADVDDWPPSERPEPEDLEAARLLGVDPRPPYRVPTGESLKAAYWDEMPANRGGKALTMKSVVQQMVEMKEAMERAGAPAPRYVIVHPDIAKDL